jgi:hypothetical protein
LISSPAGSPSLTTFEASDPPPACTSLRRRSDPQTSCRCRRVRIRPWQHGNKRFLDKLTTEVISAGPVKRVHGIRLVVALCSVSCIIAPMEPRDIHRENGRGNQHSARVKYSSESHRPRIIQSRARQFGRLGKRCRKRNRGSLDATHRSASSRSARHVTSNLGNAMRAAVRKGPAICSRRRRNPDRRRALQRIHLKRAQSFQVSEAYSLS